MIEFVPAERTLTLFESGGPPGVRAKMAAALGRALVRLQRYIAQNKMTGGGILEPRTGNTRRALYCTPVVDDGQTISGAVSVDLTKAPGARINELGGTIVPKNAKHLAIPIGEALTAKGVARFTAAQLISNPQAFGYSSTFARNGIIFGQLFGLRGAGSVLPLFALKDSVTLPARRYMASSVEDMTPQITTDLTTAYVEALRS